MEVRRRMAAHERPASPDFFVVNGGFAANGSGEFRTPRPPRGGDMPTGCLTTTGSAALLTETSPERLLFTSTVNPLAAAPAAGAVSTAQRNTTRIQKPTTPCNSGCAWRLSGDCRMSAGRAFYARTSTCLTPSPVLGLVRRVRLISLRCSRRARGRAGTAPARASREKHRCDHRVCWSPQFRTSSCP